jgi:hypothetical protein
MEFGFIVLIGFAGVCSTELAKSMESAAAAAVCAVAAGAAVTAASAHPLPIVLLHVAQLAAYPPKTTVAAPPGAGRASNVSTETVSSWAVTILTESTPPGGGRMLCPGSIMTPGVPLWV